MIIFIELCWACSTATDEKVVKPPAKPGMSAIFNNSFLVNRKATIPATTTPAILTANKAISSPFGTAKYRTKEPSAPPMATARSFFTPDLLPYW